MMDNFLETEIIECGNIMGYVTGSKNLITNLRKYNGGGGINTAVAFSRLGLKTGYIGKIGDDEDGKKILKFLKNEKINFLGVSQKNSLTDISVILTSKKAKRTILTYKHLSNELDFSELKLKELNTKWLYCSSLLGKSFKTQLKLVKILTEKGTKLALNTSEYLIKTENLNPLLKLCEVLVLNNEEAQLLTKEKDLLIGLHNLGPKIVVITNGDKLIKCYNSYENKKYYLQPRNIKVVERTGAGDAFASGFVAGMIRNKSPTQCLDLGLRESESVIKYVGATNKLLKFKLNNLKVTR